MIAARERQTRRLRGCAAACNGQLSAGAAREHIRLTDSAHRVLLEAYERTTLSTRGHHRVLRVARTVADLAASERVAREHVLEALGLRQEEERPEAAA